MKRYLLPICVIAILIVWALYGGAAKVSESGLLLLWMLGVLLVAFGWARCLYLWLFYRRAAGAFSGWVPLRTGSKRLYPEYYFEVGGMRYSLVNGEHMRGDEPWPMTVLYHPEKPQKALFLTFKEFLGLPLLQSLGFASITAAILSRPGGWSGLWAKLPELF